MRATFLLLALSMPVSGQMLQTIISGSVAAVAQTPTLMGHTSVRMDNTASSSINTTATGTGGAAATLIVVWTNCYFNVAAGAPVDSQTNTYTGLTFYQNVNLGNNIKAYYVINPTNSTTMTWSKSTCSDNGWMAIGVWSGTGALDSGSDQGVSNLAGSTDIIPPFTPSQTNDLVISFWGCYSNVTATVDSSLAIIESTTSLATADGAMAWVLYNSTSALSITWTLGGGFPGATSAAVVAFKHG